MRTRPALAFALSLSLAAICSTPAMAGIIDLPGAQSLTIWEGTSGQKVTSFSMGPPDWRLTDQIMIHPSATNYDFKGAQIEYYDVYFSNADGSFNAHGNYVSIVCFLDTLSDWGNNIDAVGVHFANGMDFFADTLVSYQFGQGINAQYLPILGHPEYSLGAPDYTYTQMGGDYSRITVTNSLLLPEPVTMTMLALGGGMVLLRRRRR